MQTMMAEWLHQPSLLKVVGSNPSIASAWLSYLTRDGKPSEFMGFESCRQITNIYLFDLNPLKNI